MAKNHLPRWIEKLLEKWLDNHLLDAIYGDLLEQYNHSLQEKGRRLAQLGLIWSTLGFVRYKSLFKSKKIDSSPSIPLDMFLNHLLISFRSLFKNAGYTLINTIGLTLGIACCLLIGLYVQDELSYDQYHENKDRIYRLAGFAAGASYENGIAKVGELWGPEAKATIPEVEASVRFVGYGRTLMTNGEDKYYERGGFLVDSTVFKVFSWNLINGDPKTALSAPNNVVISKELANKYFPNQNPVGKSLTFNNQNEMIISGVIEDIPVNSHFTFRFLVPLHSYTPPPHNDQWTTWLQYYTYLLLKPGVSPASITPKIENLFSNNMKPQASDAWSPLLQPITKIHLESKLHRELSVNSDKSYIYIFSTVALLTLIIAITNFINLFTARATHRAKEIGVRKVVGANRRSIIQQFIIEAMLVTFTSAALAILLAYFFLPNINLVLGKSLHLDLVNNFPVTLGLIGLAIVTGILSGSYPAYVLSAFKAVNILKTDGANSFLRSFSGRGRRALFRKGLVVFQFAIATFLIIAALVVTGQLDYIQQKNLGFNQDQVVNIPMSASGVRQKASTIKEELLRIPGVTHVSISANRPGGSDYGVPYKAVGLPAEEQPSMRCLVVDEDFLTTYQMEIVEGRGFSSAMPTDSTAYLINETAAAQLSWEQPVGQQLAMPAVGREPGPIIGIVKDFHFHSLHEPITPLYFFLEKTWFSQFNVKLDANRIDETLASIEDKWSDFEPDYPFRYTFFDQSFASLHAAEASTAQMIKWFTFLAIFITCLGLFGLSAYTSERRTKEIGIRKVFGASVIDISQILVKEVMLLVLVAILIAMPIAWMIGSDWLENFAYTLDFGIDYFLIAAGLALGIALIAISYHVLISAIRNPITAIKHE